MNRLLDAIPEGWGWYHFLDDDDMYYDNKVIEKLVKRAKPQAVNVGRVKRWGNVVFPKSWGRQRSYQTECFFMHTAYNKLGRWWGNKGGDHYYSRQLTSKLPIHWMEGIMIAKAQKGKSHGKPVDVGGNVVDRVDYYPNDHMVDVLIISDKSGLSGRVGSVVKAPYEIAYRLDRKKIARVTYGGVEVCDERKKQKQTKEVAEQVAEAI
jgi:hypothetical protein